MDDPNDYTYFINHLILYNNIAIIVLDIRNLYCETIVILKVINIFFINLNILLKLKNSINI